jgi:hypothetical protein
MIEAPAVLMTPGIMFQQVAQSRDAKLFKRGELGTSDPAKPCEGKFGIVGRCRGE